MGGKLGAKWDVFFNPLTPKRDWHLISPYRITAESNIRIMEIKESSWLSNKFPWQYHMVCIENSEENICTDARE